MISALVLTKKGCVHLFIRSFNLWAFILFRRSVLFYQYFACHMCRHHLLACCLRKPEEHHQILNWNYTMAVVSHGVGTGN